MHSATPTIIYALTDPSINEQIAREFEVLLKIEKVIREDKKDLLNFTEVSYQDSYGREQKKSKEGKG